MFLFLVRHASSDTPRTHWQTPDSELDEIGKEQAEILSKRSRFSGLDKIFSSDWERSRKTAEIISKNIGVDTEELSYIHERQQLTQIYGSDRNGDLSENYIKEYRENYGNLDWKFKNKEESLREVLKRTSQLSSFLAEKYQDKRVLVVSHDIFIRCFISRILLGDDYSDKEMARSINALNIKHTGISLLIYDSRWKNWKIDYINDYSHFRNEVKIDINNFSK